MEILETKINDLVIIKPSVFGDNRGYFLRVTTNQNLNQWV